jgi:phosphoglucomutase
VHPQLMNQLLDEVFELATIQSLAMEVLSVDTFDAVSADYGGLPRCLLKQFSVVWPLHWQ